MMGKKIFVVTHGEKEDGSNPSMTKVGFEQVAALRSLLPKTVALVVCGTGRRHMDVARALELAPDRYTALVGAPDSLNSERNIVLADGTVIDFNKYTTISDNRNAMPALISGLPDGAVICAGRPCVKGLGKKDAKSGAVYRVDVDENDTIVEIVEVIATGDVGAGEKEI